MRSGGNQTVKAAVSNMLNHRTKKLAEITKSEELNFRADGQSTAWAWDFGLQHKAVSINYRAFSSLSSLFCKIETKFLML